MSAEAAVGTARPSGHREDQDQTPEVVRRAAAGEEELSVQDETDVLDFLLGATQVLEYDVDVRLETDAGTRVAIFHFKQLDGSRLSEIEEENRSGDGPFSRLDAKAYNSQVVHEATVWIGTPGGRKVDIRSQKWVGSHPLGSLGALRTRFKMQSGIFDGIAAEVTRVSGYSSDRVGTAQRVHVAAAGNS